MDSLQHFIQQFTLVVIEEIKGFYAKIIQIEQIIDDFTKEIKQLIPKSKYGTLDGQCEFEKNN